LFCQTSVHRVIHTVVPSVVYDVLHTVSCGVIPGSVVCVTVGSVVGLAENGLRPVLAGEVFDGCCWFELLPNTCGEAPVCVDPVEVWPPELAPLVEPGVEESAAVVVEPAWPCCA
jgi:hypothetical protein